jgi:pyridoxamine 5'-phosphate oxidase
MGALPLYLQSSNMSSTIADIRKDYKLTSLQENDCDENPIRQFDRWWKDATSSQVEEINAMTLATASCDGIPSARIVLLKEYTDKGFVFYTNYESFKGKQLEENPRACLVFFWKELERQVRITGLVEKVSAAESDAYFKSRPTGSQVSASISPQSQVVENREWLEKNQQQFEASHTTDTIQRPVGWGGYRVKPITIEFWQGRANRLHDRIQYTLNGDGSWIRERLAP